MINIVCALPCEAKPLINRFKLRCISDSVFPLYQNEEIFLIVSGIGKVAVSNAIAFLFVKTGENKNRAWLNYGIAGHKSLAIGENVIINKVTDSVTNRHYYPVVMENVKLQKKGIVTVDQPADNYAGDSLYDMEASAFMESISRYASIEFVKLFKVVSDNECQSISSINKSFVSSLIESSLAEIVCLMERMSNLQADYARIYVQPKIYDQCIAEWHFSQYQKKQLMKLLIRWEAVVGVMEFSRLSKFNKSSEVIDFIDQGLRSYEFSL